MTYSYALSIDYSKNPYYADNPAMFMLLLSRVVNNQQHYAPIKAANRPLREWMDYATSKPEEDAFYMLVDAFGVDSVIRQYKCSRYPFNYDFYVKPLDLFIECNYFQQHGRHPFDNASKADIAILEKWKSKRRKHNAYERAIYVWTQLDVRKQQTAEDNKLNYKAFYEVEDFNRWAKSIIKVGRKDNEEVI